MLSHRLRPISLLILQLTAVFVLPNSLQMPIVAVLTPPSLILAIVPQQLPIQVSPRQFLAMILANLLQELSVPDSLSWAEEKAPRDPPESQLLSLIREEQLPNHVDMLARQ
jgi:hydrogenase-4 membrane subunit HyfE